MDFGGLIESARFIRKKSVEYSFCFWADLSKEVASKELGKLSGIKCW